MVLMDYLKQNNFLNKTKLCESEMTDLILNLVNISKLNSGNSEMVSAVMVEPPHKYKLGKDELAVIEGCRKGHLYDNDLYGTELSALKTALAQICRHTDKIKIEISEKISSGNFSLEYYIQH
ncbi:MAG: hypothetical protein V1839_04055 [archaeon]